MPLQRTPHWATREFSAHLKAHAEDPFVWGENDCCLFPANAILAFTGTDLAADFRGKYHDQAGALAAIETIACGKTVADAAAWCAAKHGLEELTHPLLAQRGDLVVLQQPFVHSFGALIAGVVHLNGCEAVTVGEGGLVRLPLSAVVRGWRV